MASRQNRRNDGSKTKFIRDLKEATNDHLPETRGAPAKVSPKGDPWSYARIRPEIATAIDALTKRHATLTGQHITKSEVIAAAFILSLPILATRLFPMVGTEGAD